MNLLGLFFSICFVVGLLKVYAWSMRSDRGTRSSRLVWRELDSAGLSMDSRELRRAPVPAPRAWDGEEPDPGLTETILVARRLAGDLAPEDYRRAMAELAAQDTGGVAGGRSGSHHK